MKSIFTKYLGPSNVRGSRYKAFDDEKRNTLTLSADDSLSSEENHLRVAQALKDKLGWKGTMTCGSTMEGIVCVFDMEKMKLNPVKKFGSRAKFKHKRLVSPKKFAKKSLRTIKRGRKRIIVGCPKGKYDVKRKVCRVGTRAQAVLTPIYAKPGEWEQRPKKNPIRHITKIKSERYAVYSPDIKGSEYPVKIFYDPNKAINYAIKRQRKTGFSSEVYFETPKGEHLSKRIYPEKYHKNPKETLYFIHAKSKKGMGLNNGLYNADRNSLTTEHAEATHYHNKYNADAKVKELKSKFKNWSWKVVPTTFFEG